MYLKSASCNFLKPAQCARDAVMFGLEEKGLLLQLINCAHIVNTLENGKANLLLAAHLWATSSYLLPYTSLAHPSSNYKRYLERKFTNIINGLIATMFCIWLVGVQRNACQDDYTQNFSKAFQHVSGTCNNLYVEERARRSVAAAKPGGQSDSGW